MNSFERVLSQPLPLGVREELQKAKGEYDEMLALLKKIVGPYVYEDDINCLMDVVILAEKILDKMGEGSILG